MAKRVLHIINSLNTGGAQVCLRDIVNRKSDEFEHFIYTLRPDVHKFDFDVEIFESGFGNYDPRKFFYLIKLCRKLNIDIVHAHLHKAAIFTLVLKKFYKCKTVLHEHGPADTKGFDYSFYRLMLKIFGNSADRIIAVSGYMRRRLWALVKDQSRIKLIYNAIDTEKFRPDGEWGKICRERHQIADSDIVIGYLGRLHYIKGVDIAIKTFAELRQKHHNLKLMIVGDGEQMEYYKKLAVSSGVASDIIFTDFTCEPQKIINAFDIALIPSRKESFGIVALEFMSAGVPVVASAVDGLKEVVADRIDGILSDNDPAALAKCVSRLIQDEALRDDLRSGGLEKVKQFNIKAYNARINNLYKSLYE